MTALPRTFCLVGGGQRLVEHLVMQGGIELLVERQRVGDLSSAAVSPTASLAAITAAISVAESSRQSRSWPESVR